MKKTKKLLSIILAILMIAASVPFAFAEEGDCTHEPVLDGDIKTPVVCDLCDETLYESDSRWYEGNYEGYLSGTIAKFKGHGVEKDTIIAYYVVKTTDAKDYDFIYDWAVNQGYMGYGKFKLHLYHNDTEVIVRDFTKTVTAYDNIMTEKYSYTAKGELQVFKFVYEKTDDGNWADSGRTAYLNNIKSIEICDIHTFEDCVCTVCGFVCSHTDSAHDGYTSEKANTHSFTCTICGKTEIEYCSGGNPTCSIEDVCTVCGADYLNPDNHEFEDGACPCGAVRIEKNENGIYEIKTRTHLIEFAQIVNGTHPYIAQDKAADAILGADLDMENAEWTPMASTALYYNTTTYPDAGYAGTFDGNGYTISNLEFVGSSTQSISLGLFGTLSGTVKNLGMENFTYTGAGQDSRVGAVAGQMLNDSLVENCYVAFVDINTTVNTTSGVAGGIAGCNYAGTVKNSFAYDITISAGRAGGIVGDNRCDISETARVGEIVNSYTDYSTISNAERPGTVTDCAIADADTFASGEIAYLLGDAWYQTIYADAYPVLDNTHGTVYYLGEDGVTNCNGDTVYYSNIEDLDDSTHIYFEYTSDNDATCTANATESAVCSCCGATDTREIPDTALGHADENGDYKCDYGCGHEFEKPAEPDTPDEPTDDTCDRCGDVHENFIERLVCMIKDFYVQFLAFLWVNADK